MNKLLRKRFLFPFFISLGINTIVCPLLFCTFSTANTLAILSKNECFCKGMTRHIEIYKPATFTKYLNGFKKNIASIVSTNLLDSTILLSNNLKNSWRGNDYNSIANMECLTRNNHYSYEVIMVFIHQNIDNCRLNYLEDLQLIDDCITTTEDQAVNFAI